MRRSSKTNSLPKVDDTSLSTSYCFEKYTGSHCQQYLKHCHDDQTSGHHDSALSTACALHAHQRDVTGLLDDISHSEYRHRHSATCAETCGRISRRVSTTGSRSFSSVSVMADTAFGNLQSVRLPLRLRRGRRVGLLLHPEGVPGVERDVDE